MSEPRHAAAQGLTEAAEWYGEGSAEKYDETLDVNLVHLDAQPSKRGGATGTPELGHGELAVEKEGGCCSPLWNAIRCAFAVIMPYGGLAASSFNMASATLGAGIISLPSAFNLSGIAMAVFYLVLITIGTIFSMSLLAKIMLASNLKNFSMAARQLLGAGADYFLAALVVLLCFGGSVAYIIATSTLLHPVLHSTFQESDNFDNIKRLFTTLVWLVLMLPLVVMKRINSLRYFSGLGVLFIVYFVGCIVYHSAANGMKDPSIREELIVMRTGNAALEGLGSFLFAFMCQLNAFDIFFEQKHQTVFHFTLYATISMTVCAVLYFLAGLFGYMDFGSAVKDSVLVLYDPVHEVYIAVGYCGIIFKICVAFALHMIPMRDAIYHCLKWNVETVPYWKHALVMAVPTTSALLGGLFIPRLNSVLGLLGSFCGGMIGFVMPALLFMYCGNFSMGKTGLPLYLATYTLLIGGVVSVVFGTAVTIYSTVINSFG